MVLGNIVPEKEVGLIKDRMRRLLDWVLDQPDLEVSTFGNMFRQYAGSRRDLVGLLDECGLAPGQAGELPLGNSGADPDFLQGLQNRKYTWPPYPRSFTGDNLRRQITGLSWTHAAAVRTASL